VKKRSAPPWFYHQDSREAQGAQTFDNIIINQVKRKRGNEKAN
jgi:hypothetical protein